MDIEVVTPPDDQAWRTIQSPEALKLQLRMLHDALDHEIEACIRSAVSACDFDISSIRRCVLPRTFKFYRPAWPAKCTEDGFKVVRLPFPPCVSVIGVTYRDVDGATQTLGSSNYIVRKSTVIPAEIVFIDASALPKTDKHPRAIGIEFSAGYGGAGPKVPDALRRLIGLYAGHFFENPEGTVNEPRIMMMNRSIDFGLQHLIDALKVPHEYRDWE
jgi:uncharacterized phiE125 gp8 family phage protein